VFWQGGWQIRRWRSSQCAPTTPDLLVGKTKKQATASALLSRAGGWFDGPLGGKQGRVQRLVRGVELRCYAGWDLQSLVMSLLGDGVSRMTMHRR